MSENNLAEFSFYPFGPKLGKYCDSIRQYDYWTPRVAPSSEAVRIIVIASNPSTGVARWMAMRNQSRMENLPHHKQQIIQLTLLYQTALLFTHAPVVLLKCRFLIQQVWVPPPSAFLTGSHVILLWIQRPHNWEQQGPKTVVSKQFRSHFPISKKQTNKQTKRKLLSKHCIYVYFSINYMHGLTIKHEIESVKAEINIDTIVLIFSSYIPLTSNCSALLEKWTWKYFFLFV